MDEIVDRDYVEQRRGGIAPSVTFGLGTSTQLTLSYFLQHEDNILDYGLPFLFGKPPDLYRGYTYLDSEIVESNEVVNGVSVVGNQMLNAPQNSFSLWTTYDFLERWQVGTGIFYVDERFANNANSNVVPSYVRWDMTVSYQITKNIQLRLNALNPTNELYFDGVHPPHVIPGAGTTIIGTALFNF